MKKAIAAMLALGMTLTMCGGTLVVRAEGDAKTYKVLSGSGEGVAAYDVFNAVVTKYQEEVNPEFNVEYEVISATSDLWQKLQMYYTADTLPDIFAISNGTLAEEMIEYSKLVNLTEVLEADGHLSDVAESMIDYHTSEDGNMYMIPSTFSGEFFVYRKPIFEKYGLEEPKTWEDFLNVCQTLVDNGEYAYVMRGADYVQYLRFASFPTWTTDGRAFIKGLTAGEYTYSDSDLGMYAAELLQKLGAGNYFVPGFDNMTLSDVVDTFMSGIGTIMYANANYVSKLSDLYDAGEIGWFAIPVVENVEGTGSTIPTHGGKAWAFNKDTYDSDPVLQDFVEYYFDHIDEISYDCGALSWYNSKIPEGKLNNLMTDIGTEMKKQTVSWVSWDDKLSAATTTTVGDAAAQLTYGTITPEEYCKIFDEALAENNG